MSLSLKRWSRFYSKTVKWVKETNKATGNDRKNDKKTNVETKGASLLLRPYHTCSKFQRPFYNLLMCLILPKMPDNCVEIV